MQTNLVANWEGHRPQIVEPDLINACVPGTPLFQDDLKEVTIPRPNGEQGTPTGTVFNEAGAGFVITQEHPAGAITAPAKFLFATDGGVVTAWTERLRADGSFDRPTDSVIVFDRSEQGGQFFGMAISPANDRLYLAEFGTQPGMVVLDENFQPVADAGFTSPFPAEYAPFNVQTVGESIFVAYAVWGTPGEEEPAPGAGKLAECGPDGTLVATWEGGNYLNAPWGITLAPAEGFGPHSGKLLVSNFGDGTIAVLDPATRTAVDLLRRPDGVRIEIDGIWALTVGNGVSLGRADAVYFAAGPGSELDGIFGRLTYGDPVD